MKAFMKFQRYHGESEKLLLETIEYDDADSPMRQPKSGSNQRLYHAFLAVLILLFVSVSLNISVFLRRYSQRCSPRNILKESSFYSPALAAIDPLLLTVRYNGSFGIRSRWSDDPNPEVDAAWNEISNIGIGRVSEEELIRSGFLTDHVAIPDENGGGYLIEFEMSHQLHCLNMLRMTAFHNFPYYHDLYPSWIVDRPTMRAHLTHCTEMLRQVLMCNADMGIVPMVWATNWTLPIPDFNTWHKCRNWDSALAFARERGLPPMEMWEPQEGERVLDDPVGLHRSEDVGSRRLGI